MSKTPNAIEVKDLSKAYKISHKVAKNTHPTVKDELVRVARKPLQLLGAAGGMEKEEFWALKDINFEVAQGDVVGIMGRNGSGKSTLFKILSRITHPTTGSAVMRGTSASMLEVGTGFHPELSGRENVYLNASILGMRKKQIDEQFDDIVAFSEVEQFIDTPVKFYSSGMKVRLAFSIAAHLDPDILIIDEVLAVGDVKFKQKSLDRMRQVADSGKTILFVSHIVSQIEALCNRGIVLDHGNMVYDGNLTKAVDKYIELNQLSEEEMEEAIHEDALGQTQVSTGELSLAIRKVEVNQDNGMSLKINATITNHVGLERDNVWLGFMVVDRTNRNVSLIANEKTGEKIRIKKDQKKVDIEIEAQGINLVPDKYYLDFGLHEMTKQYEPFHKVFKATDFVVPEYEYMNGKMLSTTKDPSPPVIYKSKFKIK